MNLDDNAEVPCNGNKNGLPPVVCVYLYFEHAQQVQSPLLDVRASKDV